MAGRPTDLFLAIVMIFFINLTYEGLLHIHIRVWNPLGNAPILCLSVFRGISTFPAAAAAAAAVGVVQISRSQRWRPESCDGEVGGEDQDLTMALPVCALDVQDSIATIFRNGDTSTLCGRQPTSSSILPSASSLPSWSRLAALLQSDNLHLRHTARHIHHTRLDTLGATAPAFRLRGMLRAFLRMPCRRAL